jgi:hypothetical protein
MNMAGRADGFKESLSKARNEVDFRASTLLAAIEDRVRRGVLLPVAFTRGAAQPQHAALASEVILSAQKVVRNLLAHVGEVHETLIPRRWPEALSAAGQDALRDLGTLRQRVEVFEAAVLRVRSNCLPRARYRQRDDGREMELVPDPRIERTLDYLLDQRPISKQRALLVEEARRGNDELVIALDHLPSIQKREILNDKTVDALTEVYLERAGKTREVESGLMAASLATMFLDACDRVVREAAALPAVDHPLLRVQPDGTSESLARLDESEQ